jgi:hypothetical protein
LLLAHLTLHLDLLLMCVMSKNSAQATQPGLGHPTRVGCSVELDPATATLATCLSSRQGEKGAELQSLREPTSFSSELVADRQFHPRQAWLRYDNALEPTGCNLAPSRHDDVDMRVSRVAMNRRYPRRCAAGVTPELIHCGARQLLEIEALGTFW